VNAADLLAALDLPAASRVDRRVPKTLLIEHGAPTPADRRHINERIDELQWVAALKPTTIGVPEYRDDVREYLEVAVLRLTLRADGNEALVARTELRSASAQRIIELVHRAVPYPVMLVIEHDQARRVGLSVANKRWSKGEAGKTVLDGEVVAVEWDAASGDLRWPAVADALALGRQPRTTMYALYQGWMDTLIAMQAASVTGTFTAAASPEQAADRFEALRECERLDAEIARVRAAAAREKQVARQVELNLALKRLEASKTAARARL
jgi:hypothetical protein